VQAFAFRTRSLRDAAVTSLLVFCGAALCWPAAADAQRRPSGSSDTSVCTASGFGSVHHPVKTSSPEAQRLFDHGMALD